MEITPCWGAKDAGNRKARRVGVDSMRTVIADPRVPGLIRRQGGRLFVWKDPHPCCGGGVTYLVTGSKPAAGHDFQRFDGEGFELWFDPGRSGPPDELHLDVKGFRRKRVEAYWNGCALVL
jgi:hypothetical protein